ncbi:MAG: ATP-dependent helicase [Candidatus Cryptobacteroides sp.]|jgi:DNA helicase-2/ATP-dependent DNA helicase PcrA
MMEEVFEELNAEQKKAVSCVDGPVLIVAGAGSGKTRVLTSRVALLLEKGVEPSRVMALTFTKKAATEMKERIARIVGSRKAWRIAMGTFHSIFIRFLREYADFLGYPPSFTIYDQSDSVSAIKACIKELQLDDKVYKPKEVQSRISLAKNNLITATAYRNNAQAVMNDTHARKPRICDIYTRYADKCKRSGVMDFDDILLNMNILLRDNPVARESIASRFDYLLVDEYQDTNFAQYLILKKLAAPHRNICVVGDDSQSIYAFRGAKIENILNFKKDYPDCRTFRLEHNYRSTANIVNAANSLIAKNENRIPKTCMAVGEDGEKIHPLSAFTEQEEALLIASRIIEIMRREHARYQDFAILYRTNSQSRALEEAFRKRNLPYAVYSGNSFFERAEVKDMMAYFKLAVNVNDDESFKRVVNKPARGIGETSLRALTELSRAEGKSLFKAAYSENSEAFGLKAAALGRIRTFCELINRYAAKIGVTGAHEVAVGLSDASGLYAFYKADNSIEGQSRASNVEELLNSVAQFEEDRREEYRIELAAESQDPEVPEKHLVTLPEFLEDISLLTAVDLQDEEDSANKIALMTVHSAKGLEFPYVFVAGLEENLFPSSGMLASPSDIEEERRLFYVAITRAEKAVCLSYAQTRMRNGKHESNSPSRFIREIDSRYLENPLSGDGVGSPGFEGGFRGFGSAHFRTGAGRSSSEYGRPRPEPFRRQYGMARDPVSSASEMSERREALKNRPLPPKIPDADFTPVPMEQLRVGQRVEHNRFGFGKILEITGRAPDKKAKIAFDKYGEKLLLLKFAKIRFE